MTQDTSYAAFLVNSMVSPDGSCREIEKSLKGVKFIKLIELDSRLPKDAITDNKSYEAIFSVGSSKSETISGIMKELATKGLYAGSFKKDYRLEK